VEVDEIDKEILTHHTESARKAFGAKMAYLVICKSDNTVVASIDAEIEEMPHQEAALLLLKTVLKTVCDLDPELEKIIGGVFDLENED